jgi:hypothetical protein
MKTELISLWKVAEDDYDRSFCVGKTNVCLLSVHCVEDEMWKELNLLRKIPEKDGERRGEEWCVGG